MKHFDNLKMSYKVIDFMKDGRNTPQDAWSLRTETVSFNLINVNRLQTTILCLLKDSYVQQSQRYVVQSLEGFDTFDVSEEINDKYNSLIAKTLDLYKRMTELKPESVGKSRTTPSDYLHNIPIEDARYILPLSAKTNIRITMSGEKFFTFLSLIGYYRKNIFADLYTEMIELLDVYGCGDMALEIDDIHAEDLIFASNESELFDMEKCVRVEIPKSSLENIAVGTLMSTAQNPIETLNTKYASEESKCNLIERVAGYGHTSVLEHARFNSIMKCSLTCFHQLIRHRVVDITPVKFDNLAMMIANRNHVIPPTILASIFAQDYRNLVKEYREFTKELVKGGHMTQAMLTMLNGDEVVFNYTANTRADIEVMQKRLCTNAQWEIRYLMQERKQLLLDSPLSFVYRKFARPDCGLNKGCQEGAYSCRPEIRNIAKLKKQKENGND